MFLSQPSDVATLVYIALPVRYWRLLCFGSPDHWSCTMRSAHRCRPCLQTSLRNPTFGLRLLYSVDSFRTTSRFGKLGCYYKDGLTGRLPCPTSRWLSVMY